MSRKTHPTIGISDEIGEGARLLFENWLPWTWKKRVQTPDIRIDYRVEVESEGEPTGKHFQAQVKGRSLHKRKRSHLSEPFKTKDLRYYLRCQEPVYLFLIDPTTKNGYWLFAQGYIRKNIPEKQLSAKKSILIKFEKAQSFSEFETFRQTLEAAWQYMHDLFPGSPIAAVLHEKHRLEALDPRFSVDVVASPGKSKLNITPKLGPVPLKFKLPPSMANQDLQAVFERGESIKIKAKEFHVLDAPLHQEILNRIGDGEVSLSGGRRFGASMRIQFKGGGSVFFTQVDGELLVAPKRHSFTGGLPDAPLIVDASREPTADNKTRAAVALRFDWGRWKSQPMLSLPFFADIARFVKADSFISECVARGNVIWTEPELIVDSDFKLTAGQAIEWIGKCRSACGSLKINPPFPESIEKLETDDVRLAVELMESGLHFQPYEGITGRCEVEKPADQSQRPTIGMAVAEMTVPEHERIFDFLGAAISIGAIRHTWTNVEIRELRPISANREEVAWIGKEGSTYKIECLSEIKTTS